MRIEEYLDYIGQPLNFIQDNKILVFILSSVMSVLFYIIEAINSGVTF